MDITFGTGGEIGLGKIFEGIENKFNNLFGVVFNNKRRSLLGVGVQNFRGDYPWYYRTSSSELLGVKVLTRDDKWEMLRRAKVFLALRNVEDFDELVGLDWRRVWNRENPNRSIETMLDLFPSLKFAHESLLPLTVRRRKRRVVEGSLFAAQELNCVDIVAAEKNGNATIRMDDICRSHSIWLDPIDAPKELYKWRLRVQRAIAWAYMNDYVPVMMTLTIYHRWNNLDGLMRVLQNSWDEFFVSGRPALRRRTEIGLIGNIRRLEITLNDGDMNFDKNGELLTNAGWHPHFHVLLFVPKDKFGTLSDMEAQMKKDWVAIVAKCFREEFREEIDKSYMLAFEACGLLFSRFNKGERKGELRPVKDGKYLDKIQGYDSTNVYGGDSEVSSDTIKSSKIPFDLLREVTAANIDLWCEYAIATKGVAALRISRPLAKRINEYFDAHPDKDPISKELPPSKIIAHLEATVYRLFYRNFLIPQLKAKAAEGFDVLRDWVRDKLVELGVSALCDDPNVLPRPPTNGGSLSF